MSAYGCGFICPASNSLIFLDNKIVSGSYEEIGDANISPWFAESAKVKPGNQWDERAPPAIVPRIDRLQGAPHGQCTPRQGQQCFRISPLPVPILAPDSAPGIGSSPSTYTISNLVIPSQAWLVPSGWDACVY